MDIQKTIDTLLVNSEEIKKSYPTVKNIRHEVKDIPYSDLLQFARSHRASVHTDATQNRVYVIYTPDEVPKMDSDFWLYSTVVKIKPAEIIAD